jgi:tetratricopeptide (TPR) repeat protein
VIRNRFLVVAFCACALAAAVGGQRLEASQAADGSAAIRERLNKVAANLFSGSGHVDDAIKEIKAILAVDPAVAEGHLLLGMAYRMQGSGDLTGEAKAEFVQALTLKPDLVPARMYLAQLYLDLGRAGSAAETLNAGLAAEPGRTELLALLGETERQRGNPRRAAELIRQALQANESFAQGRYYLGLALADLGQGAEAIKELERVVQSGPKVADAYLALGTAYVDVARVDDAVRVLQLGTTIDPSRADVRIALARAYRSKGFLIKADEQLTLARPAATAAPASVFSQQQIEPGFYLELGLLRMRQRRLEAAAEAFQKVLDLDQNHAQAKQRLAEVRKLQQSRLKPKPGGPS